MGQYSSLMGFRVGDVVRVKSHSNLPDFEDTIRDIFIQTVCREPYARNTQMPAAVLTTHSWTALENCTLVRREKVAA